MKESTFIAVCITLTALAMLTIYAIAIHPNNTNFTNQQLCLKNGLEPVTVSNDKSPFVTNYCVIPGTIKGYWINNGQLIKINSP